jgi:hypothetical protein
MAIKETVAWQVQQAMETEKITKVEIAKRMKTSRPRWTACLIPATVSTPMSVSSVTDSTGDAPGTLGVMKSN